jgi:hypothetical protein
MNTYKSMCVGIGLSTLLAGAALGQASYGPTGYSQNFNSMGTGGTAAPTGWSHFVTSFGSNSTWTTSIPAAGANSVASAPVATPATVLTAVTIPTSNNNNGYNAAASAADVTDRVLADAPTTVAGAMLQLALNNDSGQSLLAGSVLTIGFDTIRYSSVSSPNQLPGYWLFGSLDGSTWTNIETAASPNPTIVTVPNTVGVTARTVDFALASDWAAGSTMYLRWVDDNAQQTSPDQIIGLDNVSIIPAPASMMLLGIGMAASARRRR